MRNCEYMGVCQARGSRSTPSRRIRIRPRILDGANKDLSKMRGLSDRHLTEGGPDVLRMLSLYMPCDADGEVVAKNNTASFHGGTTVTKANQ